MLTTVGRNISGHKRYTGENPPDGTAIHYVLAETAKEISLKVLDADGKTMRDLPVKKDAGLHRVVWDLRRSGGSGQRSTGGAQTPQRGTGAPAGTASQAGASGFGQGFTQPRAQPGQYRLALTVDGKELTQPIIVEADPQFSGSLTAEEEDEMTERRLEHGMDIDQ